MYMSILNSLVTLTAAPLQICFFRNYDVLYDCTPTSLTTTFDGITARTDWLLQAACVVQQLSRTPRHCNEFNRARPELAEPVPLLLFSSPHYTVPLSNTPRQQHECDDDQRIVVDFEKSFRPFQPYKT